MISRFTKNIFLGLIFLYQKLISPLLGPNCRFYPTCSEYAKECFREYNVFKAIYMTVKRLLKCHPFHPGGVDHVRR